MKIKSIKYQSDDRRQVVDCVHSFEHVDNLEALENVCIIHGFMIHIWDPGPQKPFIRVTFLKYRFIHNL